MRVSLIAGFFYFLIVAIAGVGFGVLREMFVTPTTGKAIAVLIELPFMLTIAWYACQWLLRVTEVPASWVMRALVGATAFGLLIVMEQLLAFALRHLILADTTGAALAYAWTLGDWFGLAGQIAFGLFPVLLMLNNSRATLPGRA